MFVPGRGIANGGIQDAGKGGLRVWQERRRRVLRRRYAFFAWFVVHQREAQKRPCFEDGEARDRYRFLKYDHGAAALLDDVGGVDAGVPQPVEEGGQSHPNQHSAGHVLVEFLDLARRIDHIRGVDEDAAEVNHADGAEDGVVRVLPAPVVERDGREIEMRGGCGERGPEAVMGGDGTVEVVRRVP